MRPAGHYALNQWLTREYAALRHNLTYWLLCVQSIESMAYERAAVDRGCWVRINEIAYPRSAASSRGHFPGKSSAYVSRGYGYPQNPAMPSRGGAAYASHNFLKILKIFRNFTNFPKNGDIVIEGDRITARSAQPRSTRFRKQGRPPLRPRAWPRVPPGFLHLAIGPGSGAASSPTSRIPCFVTFRDASRGSRRHENARHAIGERAVSCCCLALEGFCSCRMRRRA